MKILLIILAAGFGNTKYDNKYQIISFILIIKEENFILHGIYLL